MNEVVGARGLIGQAGVNVVRAVGRNTRVHLGVRVQGGARVKKGIGSTVGVAQVVVVIEEARAGVARVANFLTQVNEVMYEVVGKATLLM